MAEVYYGCGCSHGVLIECDPNSLGWWFQHGERPEARRWFSARQPHSTRAEFYPQPILDWFDEVHAYEAAPEERVL